ncbi:hypothetical protein [Methylobacterium sp. Leaf469]|uniref:hypothetical protein n=1 Tax=Methylobacterium sp. Leaf469 TaxID=1736387 RepID=UPI000AC6A707|nr:hypothetical protein [Methylobacterium sp. Leaf469]
MLASEVEYDVYESPRLNPLQFGDYVAAEGKGCETVLRTAKFCKRGPRVRAWFARQQIGSYLTSASRSIGHLDAAEIEARRDAANASLGQQKRDDASLSADRLASFTKMLNKLKFAGKDLVALDEEQSDINIGGVSIKANISCLVKSVSRSDVSRVGAIFLNTQSGKGLGEREATAAKRKKAGETVSLLVLRRVINEFSDLGEPHPDDCMHIYINAGHF